MMAQIGLFRWAGKFKGGDVLKTPEPKKAERRVYFCDDPGLVVALEKEKRNAAEVSTLGRAEQAAAALVEYRIDGTLPTLVLRTGNWIGWMIKLRCLAPWAFDLIAPGEINIRRAQAKWRQGTGLFAEWHLLPADSWRPYAPMAKPAGAVAPAAAPPAQGTPDAFAPGSPEAVQSQVATADFNQARKEELAARRELVAPTPTLGEGNAWRLAEMIRSGVLPKDFDRKLDEEGEAEGPGFDPDE